MKRILPALTLIIATFSSPAAAQVQPCMVGTWVADLNDVADLLSMQMNGVVTPKGGEMSMQIAADGSFTSLADDMVMGMQVPDTPAFDVTVSGVGNGSFSTSVDTYMVAMTEYDMMGSAEIFGATMEIPFSSETGIDGGGAGVFECSGDTLRFEQNAGPGPANIARIWQRQ